MGSRVCREFSSSVRRLLGGREERKFAPSFPCLRRAFPSRRLGCAISGFLRGFHFSSPFGGKSTLDRGNESANRAFRARRKSARDKGTTPPTLAAAGPRQRWREAPQWPAEISFFVYFLFGSAFFFFPFGFLSRRHLGRDKLRDSFKWLSRERALPTLSIAKKTVRKGPCGML